jgi:hypothetical protein
MADLDQRSPMSVIHKRNGTESTQRHPDFNRQGTGKFSQNLQRQKSRKDSA